MKQLKILVANRLIRLTGNFFKVLSYPFHWVFPKLRFTIPAFSPAKVKLSANKAIPRIIWQTNFTDQASLPVYPSPSHLVSQFRLFAHLNSFFHPFAFSYSPFICLFSTFLSYFTIFFRLFHISGFFYILFPPRFFHFSDFFHISDSRCGFSQTHTQKYLPADLPANLSFNFYDNIYVDSL